MKKLLFVFLILTIGRISFAQEEISYPDDNPDYSIVVPKGWSYAVYDDYDLLEIYNSDQSIVYSIYKVDTILLFEAVNRAEAEAATEFYQHEFGERTEEEINGIKFHKILGKGLTDDDEIYNIEVRLFQVDVRNYYMIYYSASPQDLEYYKIELEAMNNSVITK